jgi:uncharacterized membrane protein
MISAFKSSLDTISPGRLISFSDGVFAIAVTLLVFNLKVPDIPADSAHRLLPGQLKAMLPHFIAYLISFLLIAIFWTVHHRMLNLVTHVDIRFIWINLIYLLMISFIPFPSGLIGAYPGETFSLVLYLICMFVVVAISMMMWWYAATNRRLVSKELPASIVNYFYVRGFTSLTFILLALPLAFYQYHWTPYSLFILLPINWSISKFYQRTSKDQKTDRRNDQNKEE